MVISKIVRHYIELALREWVVNKFPDWSPKIIDSFIRESMQRWGVTREVLYRAIELAAEAGTGKP